MKHYQVTKPTAKSPEPLYLWRQAWHGYYRLADVTDSFVKQTGGKDRETEVDILLGIIEEISKRKTDVRLLELGAGWGEWCMALAGIVNYKLIPHNITKFDYLAVEGVPSYCEIIHTHFRAQNLPDNVMNVAVSDEMGKCRFNMFTGKDTYYCQGMTFGGNFGGSKLKTAVLALYHLLKSKTVVVPMVTVDYLLREDRADIIHCDVQGVEEKVIRGAMRSIMNGKVDYWVIGTHNKDLNCKVKELLSPYYDCLVDILPKKEKKMRFSQDGIQFYRRKGI